MNFLAHAYLSFEHPGILAGNMISDFVKGAAKNSYPKDVRQGIELHRAIDSFTDSHPATAEARRIFRPHYRLYSGAITDILWDFFLANDAPHFSNETLLGFSGRVYQRLEAQAAVLPTVFLNVLAYMKRDNWLYRYRQEEGIAASLRGMVRRTAHLQESETAFALFKTHRADLQAVYDVFFPDVKKMAKQQFDARGD